MCHVMKKLLATIGVHPTVIELDDHEIAALPSPPPAEDDQPRNIPPSVFIGGTCVGGLESLVALHLSGHLVPKLVEVGALWV
jgi:glutaredoxin 3